MSDSSHIRDIVIAGGGDAGLLTALLIKRRYFDGNVVVVDDFDEDPPEVGKSTFAYITEILHGDLGISRRRFHEEVRPVWKSTARFEDWCGESFSIPFDEQMIMSNVPEPLQELFYRYENNSYETVGTEIARQEKTPFEVSPGADVEDITEGRPPPLEQYGQIAYHLDLQRFTPFLETVARERGISIYNGRVTGVETEGNCVTEIQSGDRSFTGDLFIDATGFHRVLMSELDTEFISFDTPLDTAVTTTVPIEASDIVPASIHTSGDSGWMWQIDTYQNRDLGYVYSSEHITDEAALTEFVNAFPDDPVDPGDVVRYGFDSGRLEEVWTGNCVAVGNAAGFMEPLQALGLTSSVIFAKRLAVMLGNREWVMHDGMQKVYNQMVTVAWEEMYNFLLTHYVFANGETPFWDDVSSLEIDGQSRYMFYDSVGYTKYGEFASSRGPDGQITSQDIYHLLLSGLGVESTFFEEMSERYDAPPHVEQRVNLLREEIETDVAGLLTYEELYDVFNWEY